MNNNESIKRKLPKDWLGKEVIIKIPEDYFFDQPFIKDGKYIVINTQKRQEKNHGNHSFVKRVIVDCPERK